MERLTKRCGEFVVVEEAIDGKHSTDEIIGILASRLAAYEDTGLAPEEIKAITSCTELRINRELTDAEVDELLQMLKQQPGTLTVCGEDKADVCVCCGEVVPEGRQVCQTCETEAGL